jgi:hypothetical protein
MSASSTETHCARCMLEAKAYLKHALLQCIFIRTGIAGRPLRPSHAALVGGRAKSTNGMVVRSYFVKPPMIVRSKLFAVSGAW